MREHQFLAATANVQYDYSRIKGFANMIYGGGFWVDHFFAGDHEGVVWIHGYGNMFEKALEPGETIDIEPGGWVFRDHSVSMTQEVYGFKTGLWAGAAASSSTASRARGASVSRAPTSTRRCRRAVAATPSARAAAGCLAASSAASSTTSRWGSLPVTSPSIPFRRGSSAPWVWRAISSSSTSPASGRAGSVHRRSSSWRPIPTRPPRRRHADLAAPAEAAR